MYFGGWVISEKRPFPSMYPHIRHTDCPYFDQMRTVSPRTMCVVFCGHRQGCPAIGTPRAGLAQRFWPSVTPLPASAASLA
jgi:hypothetical protein